MKKGLYTLAAAGLLSSAPAIAGGSSVPVDNSDPGFGAAGDVEIMARIPAPDPSGIAVIDGRLFLSFPKHDGDHAGPVLAEWKDGKVQPFPNDLWANRTDADPSNHLISPHGLTADARGHLWAIDDGKVKGQPIPSGGAKLIGIDPVSGAILSKIILDRTTLPGSHLNDLRIDLTHGTAGTAYISDSSFDGHHALVVVDIASGRQRRVLADHASVHADPGFVTFLSGRPLRADPAKPSFPGGGVDGVTLSRDGRRLYYAPLSSHRLYSLPTALLSDFTVDDAALGAAVVDEGEKGSADGLATDPWGRIYTTAGEQDAIFRRNLDGSFDLIARDPRFVWPDGIFADEHYVYVTLGQWTRLPRLNNGQDLRKPPFLVARVPIQPPG
ncbi:Sugar lactone lactonase YvrE [Sphingobium sp. YR657]|uniref:L-dopachrome tautomerase-related protein n=1 Tax=Sphingobium sp. YR657 TaxID=1884366 RepID=UPI00091D248D|nr:L-dopachrome tautomerase-related protein [Sphingobium sp. YR657]SHM44003.1 Sugar lactone lactonase YvrE [Sphingobium sp. YR657]